VLVKGVDRKPTTGDIYHVDFQRVSMTETIRMDVPIVLVGEAPATTRHDATILHSLNTLHISCLPGNLPSEVAVDIGSLVEIDDAIHVRDLALPNGVTSLTDGDELVAKAAAPQRMREEAPAEVPAAAAVPESEAAGEEAEE